MPANITVSTTPEAIAILLLDFIYIDADGSKRVKKPEMIAWITRQFGGVINNSRYSAPRVKDADAEIITRQLESIVNREHWVSHPNYPTPLNIKADSNLNLLELRDLINAEARAIEAPYRDFRAGLAARSKALFTTLIAPGFPAGVAETETTRTYVQTYVTDRGEESRPSAASALLTLGDTDSVQITMTAVPAGRSIASRRLYRSATGTTSAAFKLQGEYAAAVTVVVDAKPDKQLNDVCATFGWLEPPATLKGLTGLPNGIMAGYVDRTLHFCEPYHPYAWPAKYDKPLAHKIAGTVAVGQSLFVGTSGRPYLVTGSDAASMTEEIISSNVPCLSAKSMVAIQNSVFYASKDGIALYEGGRVMIITKGIIDREDWQAYNPASMRAGEFDGMYALFYTKGSGTKGCLLFDYMNKTIIELDQAADAVFTDASGIYIINGTAVYDAIPATGTNRIGHWYSKTFRLARPQAFGWIHVDSTFLNGATAAGATIRIYADDVLHHTAVITSGKPVRNKPGRATEWRLEIECAAPISGVVLASTTDELKAAI